jgi:hypothetical protein
MRNAYKILVGNPDEDRPLGRRRSRREDNIKMDVMETGWGQYGPDSCDSR